LLGRDYRPSRTSSANFLINDGKVAFVVGDVNGVLRLLEYDPSSESLGRILPLILKANSAAAEQISLRTPVSD
jgi:hypothetical protein